MYFIFLSDLVMKPQILVSGLTEFLRNISNSCLKQIKGRPRCKKLTYSVNYNIINMIVLETRIV